jgi:copper chaperone NosL
MRASRLVLPLVALAVVGTVAVLVARAQRLPDGPEPIAWDHQACDHCRMLIGEPGFAAQLQTKAGRVFSFDDPGCLFLHLAEQPVEVHALWFHHGVEDRWLAGDATGFVRVAQSPMGFGLRAVALDEAPELSLAQAISAVKP